MPAPRLLVVLVIVVGADCKGSSATPVRRAELVSFGATTTEEFQSSAAQQIRLEITIANTGNTPIDEVGITPGYVSFSDLTLEALFSVDPTTNTAPLPPGERRPFVFIAPWGPVGRCGVGSTCQANPHHGWLSLSISVTSDTAKWAIQTGVAVNCIGDYPKACGSSVADACQAPATGPVALRCRSHWAEVLTDTICGLSDSDLIATCPGGFKKRSVVVHGIHYDYYYDTATDSLVGIATSSDGCVAGPCEGIQTPSSCDELKPFYECPDAGDVLDSSTPDLMPGNCFPLRCLPDADAIEDAASVDRD